ncbi:acyltransferase family protein [Rossellomorea vietnamensis]|uniref:acyltransferase family protein n=1 Tax=Rossellomorea vietnamensis TaxID=218284 RepID=UPI0009E1A75A|nr:acyltransferase family protein [Rossellomorea vietnamensis]
MIPMKQRLIDLDLLKGFGIIMVVAVHSNMPQPITAFLQSFGMPLFFMLAGYTFNSKKYKGSFYLLVKKRSVSLLVPYVMGCFLSYSYWIVTKFTGDFKESFLWYKPLVGVLEGNIEGLLNYPLWFLVALYGALLMYATSQKYLQRFGLAQQFAIYAVIGWIGAVIGSVVHLPWGLDISMVSLLFIFIGDRLRQGSRFLGGIGLSLFLFSAFLINEPVSMGLREYGNLLLFYISGVSGSLLSLEIVRGITGIHHWFRAISHTGRESVYILILHAGISFPLVSYINHFILLGVPFPWFVYLVGGIVIPLYIRYIFKKSSRIIQQLRINKSLMNREKRIA